MHVETHPKYETILIEDWWPSPVKLGVKFGYIVPGWTLEDYLRAGADPKLQGYETVLIWGVQGSGKSSRALQMAYWVLRDWDAVLACLIFKPQELVATLEAVPDDERLAIIIWDDIGVHYPSSKFKTDIEQYEAIDSSWASIRTKVGVILTTIPLSDRLAKNIKDNVTFEVFLGKNQMEMIFRIYRLPSFKSLDCNFFKAMIEDPAPFDLYKVPKWVWIKYWDHRIKLAREALASLKGAVGQVIDETQWVDCIEAGSILEMSPNSIQQMSSRGVIEGIKINKRLHIKVDDLERLKELKLKGIGKPGRRRRGKLQKAQDKLDEETKKDQGQEASE